MADNTAENRVARFQVDEGSGSISTLRAIVPSQVTEKEFDLIQKTVFDRIKYTTGCPACLSGAVRVVFEEDFQDVLRVDLNTGAQV